MQRGARRLLIAVVAILGWPLPAPADVIEGASAVESGAGIGLEMSRLNRAFTLAGSDVSADGAVAGVYGYLQLGADLRLAGTLQSGSVEYSTGGGDQSESALRGDLAATWGWDAAGTRLYAGLGGNGFSTYSPFGDGRRESTSVYLPVGLARAGRLHPDWYGQVRLEARFVAAGNERIDAVTSVGDVELARAGGWGLEVGAELHHIDAPLAVEPYLRYVAPADTETKTQSGVAVRVESIRYLAGGARVTWHF